jgi:hypothetical protein
MLFGSAARQRGNWGMTAAATGFRAHPCLGQSRHGEQRRKGKSMSKPTHTAYVVQNPKPGSHSDKEAFWHKIGSVWPHKNGTGFDLVIPEGISVSGRIVITERKEASEEASEAAA